MPLKKSAYLAVLVLGLTTTTISSAFAEDPVQDQISDNILLSNPDYTNATGCSNNPSMIFQPAITGYLTSVDLPIRKYGPRVDGFNIDIMDYNEKTKIPNDGELLASQNIAADGIPDDSSDMVWSSFNIEQSPQLIANRKYVIRIFAGFDGACDGGFQWGMRKWDAPNFPRTTEIGFDQDENKWTIRDNDFGLKTYMIPHEPEVVITPKQNAQPSISFYLQPGQKKLSASDLGRLKNVLAKVSASSKVSCLAARYGTNARTSAYSLSLSKSVCGSLKKLRPEISRSLKVVDSKSIGLTAKGSKWTPDSYRVDLVITSGQ